MMADITIATPTVGSSSGRLKIMILQLRKFTGLEFKHIVSSDELHISEAEEAVQQQRSVCMDTGVAFTRNPDPGLGENLNHLMSVASSNWVAFIEDGVLPSDRWFEVMVDYLHGIQDMTFDGPEGQVQIGMVAWPHVESKHLVPFYDIPSQVPVLDWIKKCCAPRMDILELYQQVTKDFYANDASWNKGNLTLGKIDAWFKAWHAGGWKDYGAEAEATLFNSQGIDAVPSRFGVHAPSVAMFPGGLIVVRRKMWEDVGGFVPKFIFYEGGLGTKMRASGKWISVTIPAPPFIHMRGLGSNEITRRMLEGTDPRIRRGTKDVFEELSGKEYTPSATCEFHDWMHSFSSPGLCNQVADTSRFIADHISKQFV